MKNLIFTTFVIIGFAASPAIQAKGALFTLPAHSLTKAMNPPCPDPNLPDPPTVAVMNPPCPDPNLPDPPVAMNPPCPDPNLPDPPVAA